MGTVNILIKAGLLAVGLALIVIFFATMEEYRTLVAGTVSNNIDVSLSVLEAISISSPSDIAMSPDILGTGSATGSVSWSVTTNHPAGWKLEIEAATTPALKSATDSFADYTEAVSGVPETWSVDPDDSEFGFSAGGTYAESSYSNGTKFQGFEGSTKKQVAHKNGPSASGDTTTVYFKAEVGASHEQDAGDYTATITATASIQ